MNGIKIDEFASFSPLAALEAEQNVVAHEIGFNHYFGSMGCRE
jgi:hypothetical protein